MGRVTNIQNTRIVYGLEGRKYTEIQREVEILGYRSCVMCLSGNNSLLKPCAPLGA